MSELHEYERDILATEVAVYRRLAQAGLRAPRVLANCPTGDGLGHAWFMMEFVAGETWARLRQRLPVDQCDRVDADIAQQAARVNGIEGARFGRWQEDHCSSPAWATSFLLMVEDLLADAQDKSVDLPWGESRLRPSVPITGETVNTGIQYAKQGGKGQRIMAAKKVGSNSKAA